MLSRRKFMYSAAAILAVLTLFASCGAKKVAPVATGKIVFALQSEPDGYDPGITNNSFASPFMNQLFEGLVTYNALGEIVPGNAESWTISPDGKVYTFALRKNLKWSNGKPLTAKDYRYSLMRVLDPKTGARYADMLTVYVVGAEEYFGGKGPKESVGIKVINDYSLQITLKEPAPYYLGILAMWVYSPVNQQAVEASPERWTMDPATFISNGPFKVVSIKMGEGVVLQKNEFYWNADAVKLAEINFRFILEPATALSAFEKGEIDGFREVPASDIPRLRTGSDAFHILPAFGTTFYDVNTTKKPYSDPKVRRALALALDRDELIDNVLQAPSTPTIALVAPGYVFGGVDFTEAHKKYGFSSKASVEEAKKLLAEAGFPDGKGFPVLELSYYTNATVKKMVEAMQQMWEKNLNIKVKIKVQDWAIYYAGIQKLDYDIGAMGWGGDYLHPMTFLQLFTSSSTNNNAGYKNPEYDALVAKTINETDPAKAVELMHQVEDIFVRDLPVISLYSRSNTIMVAPYIKNWALTALANLYFKDAYIEKK
ncbi:MAG: peptide ABC transporter substrate-binding protein [Spirochaetes bacterium]|nr:peptide ABC transporter substrate-binding protein [Spirochaetota bacterium]